MSLFVVDEYDFFFERAPQGPVETCPPSPARQVLIGSLGFAVFTGLRFSLLSSVIIIIIIMTL